jgi:DNA-binding MarR family transcriptional regulator
MASKKIPQRQAGWSDFEAARDVNTGQLLMKAARLWNEQAIVRVQAAGGTGFRAAHTRLLPHLGPSGTRLTDLADKAGISKQAAGKLVDDLEAQGIVTREPDPADGRALLVRYTDKGVQSLLHGLGVLTALEGDIARTVGAKEMAKLRTILAAVVAALESP